MVKYRLIDVKIGYKLNCSKRVEGVFVLLKHKIPLSPNIVVFDSTYFCPNYLFIILSALFAVKKLIATFSFYTFCDIDNHFET